MTSRHQYDIKDPTLSDACRLRIELAYRYIPVFDLKM